MDNNGLPLRSQFRDCLVNEPQLSPNSHVNCAHATGMTEVPLRYRSNAKGTVSQQRTTCKYVALSCPPGTPGVSPRKARWVGPFLKWDLVLPQVLQPHHTWGLVMPVPVTIQRSFIEQITVLSIGKMELDTQYFSNLSDSQAPSLCRYRSWNSSECTIKWLV